MTGKSETCIEREYIVFELEDGGRKLHGGPYPPTKAREIHQAIHNHVRNGHHSGWRIPSDAVGAKRVTESEFHSLDMGNDGGEEQ
jgi:hypothetical protein